LRIGSSPKRPARVPHTGPRLLDVRRVGGLLAFLIAVVLGLFGVILILYQGDAGAEQDIDIGFWDAGTIDADIIGVVFVIAAAGLTLISVRMLRGV
jgi:uncharacterized membrane protein